MRFILAALALVCAVPAQAAVNWTNTERGTFQADDFWYLDSGVREITMVELRLTSDPLGATAFLRGPSTVVMTPSYKWDGTNAVNHWLRDDEVVYTVLNNEPDYVRVSYYLPRSMGPCGPAISVGAFCGDAARVDINSLAFGINGGSGPVDYKLTVTSFTAVPEPATWAMMIVGFGMLGARLRLKQAQRGHHAAASDLLF